MDTLLANQLIIGISAIIVIFSLTASSIAFIFSLVTYSKLVGLQNSTHNVQYVPIDPSVDSENREFTKEQREDNWATTEESYLDQDKKYRKERDEVMPDFAMDEDDMKIHSF